MLLRPADTPLSVKSQNDGVDVNKGSNGIPRSSNFLQEHQLTNIFYSSSSLPSPFPPIPPKSPSYPQKDARVSNSRLSHEAFLRQSTFSAHSSGNPADINVRVSENASVQLRDSRQRSASEVDSADEYIGPARLEAQRERRQQAKSTQPKHDSQLPPPSLPQSAAIDRRAVFQYPSIYPNQAFIYEPADAAEQPSSPSIADRPPPALPSLPPALWTFLLPPVKSASLSLEQRQELWPEAFPRKLSHRAVPAADTAALSSPAAPGKALKRRAVITLAPETRKRRRVLTPAQDKRSSSENSTVSTELSEESSAASLDGRPRNQRGKREYIGVAMERRCTRMDRRRVDFLTQATQTPFLEAVLPCLQADHYNRRLAKKHISGYQPAEEGQDYGTLRSSSSVTGT